MAIVGATLTKLSSTKRTVCWAFSGQRTTTAIVAMAAVAHMTGFCRFGSAMFMTTILLRGSLRCALPLMKRIV